MFASKHYSKQYRAQAAKYKERADGAITLTEKRKFQNLERSFATLAENEEWLSTNHDKTVHRTSGPAKSASSLLPNIRGADSRPRAQIATTLRQVLMSRERRDLWRRRVDGVCCPDYGASFSKRRSDSSRNLYTGDVVRRPLECLWRLRHSTGKNANHAPLRQ
jgi:hypothetical protein